MITMLRPLELLGLTSRLDQLVSTNPRLRRARTRLLIPLDLLQAMAGQAEGALAGNPLAIERLRVLLAAGGPHALPPATATILEPPRTRRTAGAKELGADASASVDAYRPGILHLGALVIVGLAASRAGAEVEMGAQFVATVQGLALAAGPAEALGRRSSRRFVDGALAAVVTAIRESGRDEDRRPAIATFLTDPAERARWTCIRRLFGRIEKQMTQTWERDFATGLLAATLSAREIEIGVPPALWSRVQSRTVRPVVANADGQVYLADAVRVDRARRRVSVANFDDSALEWVGFAAPAQIRQFGAMRSRLRSAWATANAQERGLAETPVPLEAFYPIRQRVFQPGSQWREMSAPIGASHARGR
jgi:hypothetical protein